jgi:flagellar biosynthetic protein FliR
VPLLGLVLQERAVLLVADEMMRDLFSSAFRLAAPAVVTIFLVTLAMAFMARVVPEMNIFMMGFTLRIIIGLLVVMFAVGIFADMFVVHSERYEMHVYDLLERMRPSVENP